MIVKGLILNYNTDAEVASLTGLLKNDIIWHEGRNTCMVYEPKFASGDIESVEGGFWHEDDLFVLSLSEYKAARYTEIDNRTGELISQGFVYQNLVFSLSQNAQINILGLDHTKDDPALSYPIEYSTLDDLNHYFVQDATDLHNMYLTALATKKAHVDSGTLLKDAVRDAANENEVLAIIDNR